MWYDIFDAYMNNRAESKNIYIHVGISPSNGNQRGHMPLTDHYIRSLTPALRPRKYFDGSGLFLFIPTSGSKLWRMAYRFDGKSKLLSFGEYLTVSLKDVRERSVCCPEASPRQTMNGRCDRPEPWRNGTVFRISLVNGMKAAWRSFLKSIREPSCIG